MAYKAIIVGLTSVRDHINPVVERLDLATVVGNQIVIGKGHSDGDMGVYFDVDGELTKEFLSAMNLYRKKGQNKDVTKGGMFDDNGRVRAQAFKGAKSEGFWIPVETVAEAFPEVSKLETGFEFDTLDGTLICKKYVSKATKEARTGNSQKSAKKKNDMFLQHFDTAQYGRNNYLIGLEDEIVITEKLHGTSQRVGCVLEKSIKSLTTWETICGFLADGYWDRHYEVSEWKDLIGTRRVILDDKRKEEDTGFHPISFREKAAKPFIGKLHKGETVYYEVVGYEGEGKPIMGSHPN